MISFILGLLLIFVIIMVMDIKAGLFDDPDGKENNPDYWEALKLMNDPEYMKHYNDRLKERSNNG